MSACVLWVRQEVFNILVFRPHHANRTVRFNCCMMSQWSHKVECSVETLGDCCTWMTSAVLDPPALEMVWMDEWFGPPSYRWTPRSQCWTRALWSWEQTISDQRGNVIYYLSHIHPWTIFGYSMIWLTIHQYINAWNKPFLKIEGGIIPLSIRLWIEPTVKRNRGIEYTTYLLLQ